MVHSEIAQYAGLNLNGLHIGFPFYLVTGFQFLLIHHFGALKHLDAALVEVVLKDNGA